jgi:hypothetical protein
MNTNVIFCTYGTLLTTKRKWPFEGHFLSINPIPVVEMYFHEAFWALTWSWLNSVICEHKDYPCALTWSGGRYTHAQASSNSNTLIISHRTLKLLMAALLSLLHWDYTVMCYFSKCMVLPEIYTWILHLINNW